MTLARYTRRLREGQKLAGESVAVTFTGERSALTARGAVFAVLRHPRKRTEEDAWLEEQLASRHAELGEAIGLAAEFAGLVRQRQPERLQPWLQRAATSGLGAFRNFAKRLGEDLEAVRAGVSLPWSNGQVEGQINRLKMLKRQMYGRASLALLSRRFLMTV